MSDINVGITGNYSDYLANGASMAKKPSAESDSAKEISTEITPETTVVYEKSDNSDKKAIYSINKMSAEERAAIIDEMKQAQADRQNQLISLVQKMLTGQAGVANLADLFTPDNLKDVTPEQIAQAKEDVSENGYWGVKQTSQRLFDFACALAGDDVDKMNEMKDAIEKGFKNATKAWGKDLPDICKDTLDATNKLFDDYFAAKSAQ